MTLQLRPVTPDDLPHLLALNNAAVPAVNELDEAALRAILALAHASVAVIDSSAGTDRGAMPGSGSPGLSGGGSGSDPFTAPDAPPPPALGFVVTMTPGADYQSENYTWFQSRSHDFLYVDRIVVAGAARDQGVGRLLYAAVFDEARALGAAEVVCEVNLEPPNRGSQRFHHRLGFAEVGQQNTKAGEVRVSLLAARVH